MNNTQQAVSEALQTEADTIMRGFFSASPSSMPYLLGQLSSIERMAVRHGLKITFAAKIELATGEKE